MPKTLTTNSGCLAVLNGLCLDTLNEQLWPGSGLWDRGKNIARSSLPYLKAYKPTEPLLGVGKHMLTDAMSFISTMTANDLDGDGYPNFKAADQGIWFTKNIIGEYYKATAKLDFG